MKNQDHSDDFSRNPTNLKRKWYYDHENSMNSPHEAKTVRKTVCYDYENYQPNHQISPTVESASLPYDDAIAKHNHGNAIELSESVEFVNILYENNLLANVQSPIQAEPNFINFETNWNNADILDLDQRNYYYETAVHSENGQQTYHHEQRVGDVPKPQEIQEISNHGQPMTVANHSSRKYFGAAVWSPSNVHHLYHKTELIIDQSQFFFLNKLFKFGN